ncbi:hypothetical protein Tco_0307677 [Tanacetum coccineum]
MPNVDIPHGMDTGGSPRCQDTIGGTPAQTRSERVLEKPNESPLSECHTSRSEEGSMEYHFELTDNEPPTPHDSPFSGGNTPGSEEGLDLEKRMDAHAIEILRLKKRVRDLKSRKSSTSQPRRRKYRQIDSSDDDLNEEDASKQGRSSDKTEPIIRQAVWNLNQGIKQGWLDAYRKVIGLDGCFLTHTCKGQLLIAISRDGNNQMYPVAWAVGLLEVVADILLDLEHRQFAQHIYANFKRKWSELQYKRLFWGVASCTVDQQFLLKMEQIKELDPAAHKWLVERNPNSWCRAFFEIDRCFAAFENGISESFNSKIVPARGKPIITMLEDIRIYIMQRMCHMNKVSFKLEDTVTSYVRKRLELLKDKQRSWLIYLSGFRDVELSGIPCVHAMAAYYHMNMEPKLGVNEVFSKQSWYNAYQYSIRPVPGSKLWKPCDTPTPLPPIQRKRPGRPKKQRISHPIEDEHHVFRVGRAMHCHNYWEAGHNKKGCQNQPRAKPPGMGTSLKSQSLPNSYVDQSRPPTGNTNVLIGSSKKRGTIRIGSSIKRGEENQVTEGGSMDDGNLTAENKIDMEALAEVERENAADKAEQERIRQICAKNEANDLYWENMAKEFRDEELHGPKDLLDNAYSFDTISDFQDNDLNVYQVSVDLLVNEAPENYTTKESHTEDPDLKPIVPTQESQIQTRSKIRKQVTATISMRIFVKNRGISERIAMMKAKKFKFDANGIGSTADKAFDVLRMKSSY